MAKVKTRTLHVPTVGTVLTLAADWTFDLLAEYRNEGMMAYLKAQGVIPEDAPSHLPVLCRQPIEGTVRRLRAEAAGQRWQWGRSYTDADYEDVPHTYHCYREAGHDGPCDKDTRVRQHIARYECTVPAGAQLRVDRIYIRKGKAEYDSLTFWAQGLSAKRVRFFARLADVNRMVVLDGEPPPVPRARTPPPAPVFRAILLRE